MEGDEGRVEENGRLLNVLKLEQKTAWQLLNAYCNSSHTH